MCELVCTTNPIIKHRFLFDKYNTHYFVTHVTQFKAMTTILFQIYQHTDHFEDTQLEEEIYIFRATESTINY